MRNLEGLEAREQVLLPALLRAGQQRHDAPAPPRAGPLAGSAAPAFELGLQIPQQLACLAVGRIVAGEATPGPPRPPPHNTRPGPPAPPRPPNAAEPPA